VGQFVVAISRGFCGTTSVPATVESMDVIAKSETTRELAILK